MEVPVMQTRPKLQSFTAVRFTVRIPTVFYRPDALPPPNQPTASKCWKQDHQSQWSSSSTTSSSVMCTVGRLTKAFIDCLYDRVKFHCHDDAAADFITTAVRLLRQPKMDFHSCTLGIRVSSPVFFFRSSGLNCDTTSVSTVLVSPFNVVHGLV